MADRFRLPCPNCGSANEVELRQAGESIACAQCRHEIEVPTLRHLRQMQSIVTTMDARQRSTGAGQFLVSRATFALGLIVLCIGLSVGGGLYYSAAQLKTIPPNDEIDKMNADVFAGIDRNSLTEFWKTWHEQIIAHPPATFKESIWAENRRIARTRRTIGNWFLGLVPLGVAALVGSAFIRK